MPSHINCMSNKSCPILYSNLLCKLGQDLLDVQHKRIRTWTPAASPSPSPAASAARSSRVPFLPTTILETLMGQCHLDFYFVMDGNLVGY